LTTFAATPDFEGRSEAPLLRAYAGFLIGATVVLGAILTVRDPSLGPLWAIGVLGFVAVCAERQPVRISANVELTVSMLPVLFAAVAFGPLSAMAVAVIGLLGDFRRPYLRWAVWTSMRALAGGFAGLVAASISHDAGTFGSLLAAVGAAALTDAVVDASLGALVVAARGTGSPREFMRGLGPILLVTVPLYSPLIALLVYAYSELSPWSVLLFFVPAFAAHSLYRLYREQREAAELLGRVNDRLERASLSFAGALVAALDARDRYTAGHSAAVAVYARDIAERLQLSQEERQLAYLAGLVHDVGKVGLPPGLLEKAGPLTLDERRIMEQHSEIGERILRNVDGYELIATVVRHHHERMDGNGYPDGLVADQIPLVSKIISVADAYNAMTSGRPYRDAMPSRVARMRLAQAVGSQFDTTVVAAFEAILASSSESYLSGDRADFALEAQRHSPLSLESALSAA
jgi:putative nucleotidyltransferase with HDIG domain